MIVVAGGWRSLLTIAADECGLSSTTWPCHSDACSIQPVEQPGELRLDLSRDPVGTVIHFAKRRAAGHGVFMAESALPRRVDKRANLRQQFGLCDRSHEPMPNGHHINAKIQGRRGPGALRTI